MKPSVLEIKCIPLSFKKTRAPGSKTSKLFDEILLIHLSDLHSSSQEISLADQNEKCIYEALSFDCNVINIVVNVNTRLFV